MSTVAVTPSVVWRNPRPKGGLCYYVRVPEEYRPAPMFDPHLSLRLACTMCKKVTLLGAGRIYRYNIAINALEVKLPYSQTCEHDENRFFEFTKEDQAG